MRELQGECGTPYELQRNTRSSAQSPDSNVAASYFGISLRPFCFPPLNTSLISPGWSVKIRRRGQNRGLQLSRQTATSPLLILEFLFVHFVSPP